MAHMLKSALLASLACAALAGAAKAEVVYHRGNAGEPKTLDQHQTSIDVESNVRKDLYEGLVAYNPQGEVVPGGAASWTISDDGLTYTFKLRGKWSNGDEVKASDWVYTFRRLMDPKSAAKYATLHYAIKNAEKVNKGETPVDQLGVRAVDDKTFEITLTQPTPYYLELLTHQTGLPVHHVISAPAAQLAPAASARAELDLPAISPRPAAAVA